MKLTLPLIHKLKRLANGDALPASQLKGVWVEELKQENLLMVEVHGTKRNYRVKNVKAFLFLVNSYSPIKCSLNGSFFLVNPPDGSFVFVADWQSFIIPTDTLVIVIENMENFRRIRQQFSLFEYQLTDKEHDILFVSRYPQSTDLRQWLCSIPNRCVHFGDFDLAGIHIFKSEFQKYLGDRSSFLIPKDIEKRLSKGSCYRYDAQYEQFRHLQSIDNKKLQWLIDLIHKYRRGYDQEGYIE